MPGVRLPAGDSRVNRSSPTTGQLYTWLGYLRVETTASTFQELCWYAINFDPFHIEGFQYRSGTGLRVVGNGGVDEALFTLSTGVWYAVALRRSGDDLDVYVRPDGGSVTHYGPFTTDQTGRGNWNNLIVGEFGHTYADAKQLTRIYDRALSQSEIEDEWDSVTPVSTTDLVADWQFANDTTDATRRADSSGNGYHWGGLEDEDWGSSDLPLVFSAGPSDIVLEAHVDAGVSMGGELAVERVLEASVSLAVGVTASAMVERLLTAGVSVGVVSEATLFVERLLQAASAFGVHVAADATVERVLSAVLDAAVVVAADLQVDEPDAPDMVAALTMGFGFAAALTVERVLSADVQIPFTIAATLAGMRDLPWSYQTRSRAVSTVARSRSVLTEARCAA